MAATFNSSLVMGPEAHLYHESRDKLAAQTDGLLAVGILFMITTWVSTVLRVYVRAFLIKSFGIDDIFAVLTLIVFSVYGVVFFLLCRGISSLNPELANGETPTSEYLPQIVVAGYCLYGATMICFKFALGLFFWKIFHSDPRYRITILLSISLPTLFGILNIIWTCLYPCEVEQFFFIGLASCPGQRSDDAWLAVTAVWSLLTAITDLMYGVLSVLAIRTLQMRWRAKATAACLCALGSIGGLASIVRFVLLIVNDMPGISQLGASLLAAQWSIIEPGMGITAAALATLRPLIRKLNEGSTRPTGSSTREYNGTRGATARTSRLGTKSGDAGILMEVELQQYEGESTLTVAESEMAGGGSHGLSKDAARPAQIV